MEICMNSRFKGLLWCAEVRRLLTQDGHVVDGPFFKSKFFTGRQMVVHQDIFGCWDLVSWKDGQFNFHQVTDMAHKSSHEKVIEASGMTGWLWCRTKVNNRIHYRIFMNGCELNAWKEGYHDVSALQEWDGIWRASLRFRHMRISPLSILWHLRLRSAHSWIR